MRCATCGKEVRFKEVYFATRRGEAVCPDGHSNQLTFLSSAIALAVALAVFFLSDVLLKPVLPGHWRFIPNAASLIVAHVGVIRLLGKLRQKGAE
jgi:hypothetical protein